MTSSSRHADDRLVPLSETLKRYPYTRVNLERLEAKGRFPRRVKLGTGKTGRVAHWQSDLEAYDAALDRAAAEGGGIIWQPPKLVDAAD
jgi:predicted DNA-binding transcriptional regulator AlpA